MATLVFLLNAMYGGNLPPSDVQANITVKGVSYVINLLYIVEIVLGSFYFEFEDNKPNSRYTITEHDFILNIAEMLYCQRDAKQ